MIPQIEQMIKDFFEKNKYLDNIDNILTEKISVKQIRSVENEILSFLTIMIKKNSQKKVLVKFPRRYDNKQAKITLLKEYKNLKFMYKKLSKINFQNSVPKVYFLKKINGYLVLTLEYFDAQLLSEVLLSKSDSLLLNFQKYYPSILEWYTKFFSVFENQFVQLSVYEHLISLLKKFNIISKNNKLPIDKIIEADKEFLCNIRVSPQHNDFHSDNIFLSDKGVLFLIDWEDFSLFSLPGFDCIHFLYSFVDLIYYLLAINGKFEEMYLLSTQEKYIQIFENYLTYCIDMKILPTEIKKHCFIYYLLKSIILSIDPRKNAVDFTKKFKILLSTLPMKIDDFMEAIEFYHLCNFLPYYPNKNNLIKERIDYLVKRFNKRNIRF